MNILIDVGEFGWSLSKIIPHFRYLALEKDIPIYVVGYKNRRHLYSDFYSGWIDLPTKYSKFVQNCMRLDDMTDANYKHIKRVCRKRFKCKEPKFYIPSIDYNHCNRGATPKNERIYIKYKPEPLNLHFADRLIGFDKPYMVVFPRYRNTYKSLRQRNYEEEDYKELIKLILASERFKDFNVVLLGLPETSRILGNSNRIIDLTEIVVSDYSAFCVSVLSKATLTLGTQSGGVILSMQCGIPTYMWGHEKVRHRDEENVHNIPTGFSSGYGIKPKDLLKNILEFYNENNI